MFYRLIGRFLTALVLGCAAGLAAGGSYEAPLPAQLSTDPDLARICLARTYCPAPTVSPTAWASPPMSRPIAARRILMVFMAKPQEFSDGWWQQNLRPFYGILMLLCGLGGGVVGLIALIRKRERSWLVWLTLLPGAFVLFLVLGEFLVPH